MCIGLVQLTLPSQVLHIANEAANLAASSLRVTAVEAAKRRLKVRKQRLTGTTAQSSSCNKAVHLVDKRLGPFLRSRVFVSAYVHARPTNSRVSIEVRGPGHP